MTYLLTDFLNYTQWDDTNKGGILMSYMTILAWLLQSLFLEVESLVTIFYISTISQ